MFKQGKVKRLILIRDKVNHPPHRYTQVARSVYCIVIMKALI